MSDDITISGPQRVTVGISDLIEEGLQFGLLADDLKAIKSDLHYLDLSIGNGLLVMADAPRSALLAEQEIHESLRLLNQASRELQKLETGLLESARAYETVEVGLDRSFQALFAGLGFFVGSKTPQLALLLLPLGLPIFGTWLYFANLPKESKEKIQDATSKWFSENSAVMSDPIFVDWVRHTVMSSDDYIAGLLNFPSWLNEALGDEGLGLTGPDTVMTAGASAAVAFGLLQVTPVTVQQVPNPKLVEPVSGVAKRVERIPHDDAQVRIDKYTTPDGKQRFEVYIGGTANVLVTGSTNPWDMNSNFISAGGMKSASYRSVEEAMEMAGITDSSDVVITGYSQGGLLAAQLAASGDYRVAGLITIAAPAGQVAVPHEIPYLAVEHTNDLVPALGGEFATSKPLLITRQIFDGPPDTSKFMLPAHQLSGYLQTASLIDESNDPRIADLLNKFAEPADAKISSSYFLAKRSGEG